jgi:hypothetical protein
VRTHRQLVVYQSIFGVLHEPGCPFCRFLKEFQAERLQNHSETSIRHVCNFHAWGLAAVQSTPTAAEAFIRLVNESSLNGNGITACDICNEVTAEEELRIREFASSASRPEISLWLRTDAVLCIPHATKLRPKVPFVLVPRIDAIIRDYREQLTSELLQLRDEPGPNRSGWGVLGRAAEFLVSQRGLRV